MPKTIFPIEIATAAEAIRAGKLVAFPTETVYGLGANALDAEAVARIYAAKGRPASSPLIVHVASVEEARALAAEWPEAAAKLAERFWPGPLTLVVRKRDAIPNIVTAGLDTVGLRIPANEIALALIRAVGVPIAAPSANRFTELSPTRAEHVRESLPEVILLDGGPTTVGIESTVVALSGNGLVLLRPGTITREQIESIAGPIFGDSSDHLHRSPGQHRKHYMPRTPLLLQLPERGRGAFLAINSEEHPGVRIQMPRDPLQYASRIYDVLHELDHEGLDWIAVEPPPPTSEWDGVRDRLTRAAS